MHKVEDNFKRNVEELKIVVPDVSITNEGHYIISGDIGYFLACEVHPDSEEGIIVAASNKLTKGQLVIGLAKIIKHIDENWED